MPLSGTGTGWRHLARRLSGGGAVFHDTGNLNFTFLVPTKDYDLSRQMSVILEAVRGLGIDAQKSGRNDITIDGKKFSGNAFCQKGENSYHHGTLMLHVDTQKVAHYLNVSEKKRVPKVFLRFLPVYATSVILFLP